MLSWVISGSYRNKDLNILGDMPRPTPCDVVGMPSEAQIFSLKCRHLPGPESRSGVSLESIGPATAVLPVTGG